MSMKSAFCLKSGVNQLHTTSGSQDTEFLFLDDLEPGDSYKTDSYKEKTVYNLQPSVNPWSLNRLVQLHIIRISCPLDEIT